MTREQSCDIRPGDLVQFVCGDPVSLGIVVGLLPNGYTAVLWDDGVQVPMRTEDLEVVNAR